MNRKAMVLMIVAIVAAVSATEWASGPEGATSRGSRDGAVRGGRGAGPRAEARPEDGGEGPRGRWGRGARLTEEQEKEVLAVLEKWAPERYKRLMQVKETSPGRYHMYLASVWGWYQDFKQMPDKVKKAQIARQNAHVRIGVLLAKADETQSEGQLREIKTELAQQVATMFDSEQVDREYRLSQLERRIAELRAELKDRQEKRDKIIARRVEELLSGKRGPGGRAPEAPKPAVIRP